MWILYGNISELRNVGAYPWKSSLFFLTGSSLEIGLSRAKAEYLAEHLTIRGVRCVRDDP